MQPTTDFNPKTAAKKLLREGQHMSLAAHLDVFTANESGLLNLALDPAFATNHFIYLYYSPSATSVDRTTQRYSPMFMLPAYDATALAMLGFGILAAGAFALGFNLSWTMTALAPDRLMKAPP